MIVEAVRHAGPSRLASFLESRIAFLEVIRLHQLAAKFSRKPAGGARINTARPLNMLHAGSKRCGTRSGQINRKPFRSVQHLAGGRNGLNQAPMQSLLSMEQSARQAQLESTPCTNRSFHRVVDE